MIDPFKLVKRNCDVTGTFDALKNEAYQCALVEKTLHLHNLHKCTQTYLCHFSTVIFPLTVIGQYMFIYSHTVLCLFVSISVRLTISCFLSTDFTVYHAKLCEASLCLNCIVIFIFLSVITQFTHKYLWFIHYIHNTFHPPNFFF